MLTLPDNSLYAVLALILSAGVALLLWPVARRIGLVDKPDDDLKDHESETPIVGGIAVFVAFHGGLALAGQFDVWLLGVTLFLLLVGIADDLLGLSPWMRLGAAGVAGALLVYAVDADSDLFAALAVVLLIVVAVNAVNLLDGADGVAGSAGLVTALGFVFLALIRDVDAIAPLLLAGSLGGFLILNWPKARIFLGDGGAYVVAAGLAYLAVSTTASSPDASGPWLPELLVGVALLGVYLVDLVVTLLRRLLSRQPLFGGDRSHVYDQLADMGWSAERVAIAVASTQFGLVALIVIADWLVEPTLSAVIAVFLVHLAVTLLCAAGFASRRQPQVAASEIFQDPDSATTP